MWFCNCSFFQFLVINLTFRYKCFQNVTLTSLVISKKISKTHSTQFPVKFSKISNSLFSNIFKFPSKMVWTTQPVVSPIYPPFLVFFQKGRIRPPGTNPRRTVSNTWFYKSIMILVFYLTPEYSDRDYQCCLALKNTPIYHLLF